MVRKLSYTEEYLLKESAKDLIQKLTDTGDLIHVKQLAYGYWSDENKESFQVQVVVTRCKKDFLGPLQTEKKPGCNG